MSEEAYTAQPKTQCLTVKYIHLIAHEVPESHGAMMCEHLTAQHTSQGSLSQQNIISAEPTGADLHCPMLGPGTGAA